MRLVIDSNRLIAGLLRDSVNRQIIQSGDFQFFAPRYILSEIRKHEVALLRKSGLDRKSFDTTLQTLLDHVRLAPFEELSSALPGAINIMQDIDITDAPFLALGIAMKADGIWSEDQHFRQQRELPVYHTGDLLKLLDKR